MSNAKHIGRIGALAVALGVGFAVATTPPAGYAEPTASAPTAACTRTDATCALILGGTSIPTPDSYYVETVRNQFIAPTHPGQDIDYVAVTTPEELWPLTGLARLLGLVLGPPELTGPGGPAWPDEPWWKLSGLFDLTADQSLKAGVADLEAAMAAHPNDHLVILGYSQGAGVANVEKRKLAEHYPGPDAPDIDFVLLGDPNLPNGGLMSRFPGLYIPILDFSFNGPALTDTQFDTVEINRQYDGFADFPLYPLNLVADLNAVLGIVYTHMYLFDVSLPADPTETSPAYQGKHGDTDYYFFENSDLPLFGPLRTLGVPEQLIDVVEPFFKVIVDTAYDRSIPPWEPTPARLSPPLNLETVAEDLVNAIGEGIANAQALVGSAPLGLPAAPVTADRNAAVRQKFSEQTSTVQGIGRDMTDGVAQVLNEIGSLLPKHPALTPDGLGTNQRQVDRVLAGTRDQIQHSLGAVRSAFEKGHAGVRSVDGDNGFTVGSPSHARKTPVRDAVTKAANDFKKAVSKTSHSLKKTLSGGRGGYNHRADGDQVGAHEAAD